MTSMVLKAGTVTLVIGLAAILLQRNAEHQLKERLETVLQNLLRAEHKYKASSKLTEPRRVAVGLGSCLDALTSAVDLFNKISLQPPDIDQAKHHGTIGTPQQLAEGFAYFFSYGAAAERYVHDKLLFKRLVAAARDLPDARWVIGGNSPVMANRMAREGCKVLLGSILSDVLVKEIEPNVQVSYYSPNKEEDVHLIMEYETGANWGDFTAPRANRFILHSDSSNAHLSSLESFRDKLKSFDAHAIVIGGLQMMDNFPFKGDERSKRLALLRRMLIDDVPKDVPVHFEFASFVEEATVLDIIDNVVLYSDSLGMNEQELPNLHSLLNYGNISVVSDPYPRVATVLDQMRSVYKNLRTARTAEHRPLSRLHVHTLAFQAILTTKASMWKNTMSAAAKASLTAHRHVCSSKGVELDNAQLIMDESFSLSREQGSQRVPFEYNRPVSCWAEEDYEICIAPVLVCTQVAQTAGCGDNISSAALSVQI